jgi:ABC-type branched-subunit amino acid transport system permease subunit
MLLAAIVVPIQVDGYMLNLITRLLIFAIFAVGFDLLWGYGGILSFGHAAFFGLGAYMMAKFTTIYSFSGVSYAGLLASVAVAGFAGLLVSAPLFYRGIRDEFIVIITLAVTIIVQRLLSVFSFTGGSSGLFGIPPLQLGIPYIYMRPVEGVSLFYVSLAILVLTALLAYRIVKSPFGRVVVSIRENQRKVESLGYDVRKYKTILFVISAVFAGFAGALFAAYSGFISPYSAGFVFSTLVILWVIVGGRGYIVGAIVGSLLVPGLENTISSAFTDSWPLVYGIALIILVLAVPQGLVGSIQSRLG